MDQFLVKSSSTESLNSKRSAEDSQWRTAKRIAVLRDPSKFDKSRELPVHNKFNVLPLDGETGSQDDETTTLFKEASTTIKKSGHIPPIILDIKPDWTHMTIKDMVSQYTTRFNLQYRGRNKVAIICYSSESHQKLKEGMKTKGAAFLTYTRRDEKTPKVVIKGLPAYVEKDLPDELVKLGFKGATVKMLHSNKFQESPCPPFLIQLPVDCDIAKFCRLKYLFNCVVRIEKFKSRNSLGTQCFRCQRFGHAARNCNLSPRCVKCTENHLSAECPKKDRSKPAHCCNCKEEHPANYRQCSMRLDYLKKLQQKKDKERNPPKLFNFPVSSKFPVKSWASIVSENKATTILEPETSVKARQQVILPIPPDINNDSCTTEMLEILKSIKSLKTQFISCTSMLEKIILVISHLGHYV